MSRSHHPRPVLAADPGRAGPRRDFGVGAGTCAPNGGDAMMSAGFVAAVVLGAAVAVCAAVIMVLAVGFATIVGTLGPESRMGRWMQGDPFGTGMLCAAVTLIVLGVVIMVACAVTS